MIILKVRRGNIYEKYIDLKLEPAGLDKINKSTLIQIFSDLIKEIKPNIILLPFQNDVHSDHRIVFETAYACTKAFRYPYIELSLIHI